nr:restriction endonuclease subunit S [uncultured Flavobacterium sp.]
MKHERLGNIATFINGAAFKPEDWNNEGLKIIRIQNLTNPNKPYNKTLRKVDDKYIVKKGDVLVSWSATIDVFIWEEDDDALLNQHIFKVVFDFSKVEKRYFIFALKQTIDELTKFAHGSTMKHVIKRDFDNHKILLPSLQDQIRIANILSKAENLINQRKESIALLDELLKSTFLEMFGDPLSNPKKFPIRKLNEFYISPKEGTKCGPFGSALKKDEYKSEGIPVWVMDNISKNGEFIEKNSLWVDLNKFNGLKSYSVINNDVIISRAGTVGKMCVVKTNQKFSLISTNLIRVRFGENLLPLHFVSLMKYSIERIAKLRTGAEGTFTHMNTGILDNIIFPYPPLELQNQFATIVEKVETLKTEYQSSLKELENMYGVLSQKAFKGELKVKEYTNKEVLGMVAETKGGY